MMQIAYPSCDFLMFFFIMVTESYSTYSKVVIYTITSLFSLNWLLTVILGSGDEFGTDTMYQELNGPSGGPCLPNKLPSWVSDTIMPDIYQMGWPQV